MATNATGEQESVEQSKTERRAEWEAFEFRVPAEGAVRVENTSYGEESDEHVYVVSVESGIPFDCSCPAWEYHNPEDGCKHMITVENQSAVLLAASADEHERVATDGGEIKEVGDTFVRTDLGYDLPEITHHVEPEHVGGKRYARCEDCESESIFGAARILHDDECPGHWQ